MPATIKCLVCSIVTANCGMAIEKAKFVFMWDEGLLPMLAYPRMVCRDCAAAEIKGRYIYGVTEQP